MFYQGPHLYCAGLILLSIRAEVYRHPEGWEEEMMIHEKVIVCYNEACGGKIYYNNDIDK